MFSPANHMGFAGENTCKGGFFSKNLMAKRRKDIEDGDERGKNWKEGELIKQFNLKRITEYQTPLLKEWFAVENPTFTSKEAEIFEEKHLLILKNFSGWSEEDLKMKFITHILDLGHLHDENGIIGYFDKIIWAKIDDIKLIVKSDFMMAKGILDVFETPYFHFQEYKPHKNPSGDSMAQLLEAFLIAQARNEAKNPLYGVEIIGENWRFITMEGKEYCISKALDSTQKEDLLKIIAILRKFKHILLTRLID